MDTTTNTYQKVAQHCQEFCPCDCNNATNSTSESQNVSCLNCEHFNEQNHCNLDLYDKIVGRV